MRNPSVTLISTGLVKPNRLPSQLDYPAQSSQSGSPQPADPMSAPDPMGGQPGAKASRDEAGFIEAARSCANCTSWTAQSGECAKVEGAMDPNDRCESYFSPVPRAGQSAAPPHAESMEPSAAGVPDEME